MAQGNGRQTGYRDERQSRDDRRSDNRERDVPSTKPKAVYALTERGEKTFWTRVGVAFVNRDESITVRMEALPLSGTLNIRDDGERDSNQDGH